MKTFLLRHFSIVSIVNFERVNMFQFINKKVKATEKSKKIFSSSFYKNPLMKNL